MQVVQALIEHAWLAPLPPVVWYLQRTRTARAFATVIRGEIRDRWLRAEGAPEETCHELAGDTVRRDLQSS
ncbi:MAG: hypothetical protein JWO79_720 [Actinomycetia bacterium]|nr:hypothetical protein [Actinomycetes bacterium]